MNIAVINIKDIVKYAIKAGIILVIIYICVQFFRNSDNQKENLITEKIILEISDYSFLDCLDATISLISYNKENEREGNVLTNDKILAMGAGIFDDSILEETDLVIDEEELNEDDVEEVTSQYVEISKDAETEEVEENNITAKYTTSYGDVKINNQSKYDLTEEMLTPDVEIENKEDILIYHTHTCESYTQSERL